MASCFSGDMKQKIRETERETESPVHNRQEEEERGTGDDQSKL